MGKGKYDQIHYKKCNTGQKKYSNSCTKENENYNRNDYLKERFKYFVKTSRRGRQDKQYKMRYPNDKDQYHDKHKHTDNEYYINRPYSIHRHTIHMQPMIYDRIPFFNKFR